MEFLDVAREIERLSYRLTYKEDLFYDINGKPIISQEQWDAETKILKELNYEEDYLFFDLLAHLCPKTKWSW